MSSYVSLHTDPVKKINGVSWGGLHCWVLVGNGIPQDEICEKRIETHMHARTHTHTHKYRHEHVHAHMHKCKHTKCNLRRSCW